MRHAIDSGMTGDKVAALRPIQQSLSEERGPAAFLEANTRGAAVRFLELRSAAEPVPR